MDEIRHIFGGERDKVPLTPTSERESVTRRVNEHEVRLNRIDAEIDATTGALEAHIKASKAPTRKGH
jgi:hypothetical protein